MNVTDARLEPSPATASSPDLLDRALRWFGHRRWLRYGARDRLIRLLRHPEQRRAVSFETPFAGFVYEGSMSRWLDWIVYYFGAYEQDEMELASALLAGQSRPVIFDVGANLGHHTLYYASLGGEVHAFEPYEPVGRHIDEKIARNRLTNVKVHRVGLSDQDEELEYYAPQGSNTGTGTFVPTHETGNNRPAGRLQLVAGDAFVGALSLPALHFVKIDVEGFELNVIRGLRETLRTHCPIVMMELSDSARAGLSNVEELLAMFPPGYAAEIVRPHPHRWMFFDMPGCRLTPLRQLSSGPSPGGYVNLLLRAANAGSGSINSRS